ADAAGSHAGPGPDAPAAAGPGGAAAAAKPAAADAADFPAEPGPDAVAAAGSGAAVEPASPAAGAERCCSERRAVPSAEPVRPPSFFLPAWPRYPVEHARASAERRHQCSIQGAALRQAASGLLSSSKYWYS